MRNYLLDLSKLFLVITWGLLISFGISLYLYTAASLMHGGTGKEASVSAAARTISSVVAYIALLGFALFLIAVHTPTQIRKSILVATVPVVLFGGSLYAFVFGSFMTAGIGIVASICIPSIAALFLKKVPEVTIPA